MHQHDIDRLRGHAFLPSELREGIPQLYATDGTPFSEKTVHLKFFCGACTWHVAELGTGAEADLAFGHADLGDPMNAEWGYFDLSELRAATIATPFGFTLVVERDLHFTPTLWSAVQRERDNKS